MMFKKYQLILNFSKVGFEKLMYCLKLLQVLPSVDWISFYVFLLQGSGRDWI